MTATAVLERPAPFVPAPPPDAPGRGPTVWLKVVAIATALVAVAALVVAMAKPSSAEKKDAAIQSYAFTPAAMTVHVGDTVTWTNNDVAPHTVTSSKGPASIDSPTLKKGDTYSYTFTVAGTYEYFCAIHPDMKGSVVVQPAPGPAVASAPAPPAPAAPAASHAAMSMPAATPPTATPAPAPAIPAASAPAAPVAASASTMPAPAACAGQSALTAMMSPLVVHLEKAHLETSPGQQAADLLDLDQYVKTHTVLLESIVSPLLDVLMALPQGLTPLVAHLDKAHLETSPGQQAADLLAVDQYVKTHTVLAGDIVAPGLTAAGAC